MSILDRISALLNGREQQELTNYLKLKKTAYSDWKSGKSESYRKYIVEIADFFGVSIDYLVYGKEKTSSVNLTEDESELLKYYKQLPEKEKNRLIGRAEAIADMYSEIAPEPTPPMIIINHSVYKVSAGTGEILTGSDEWNEIEVPDTPEARKADFCLTICGNSMEPVYYDGDIVLIKKQPQVERGQIGIFIIENNGYIKKLGDDRLISLNDQYEDIMFSDYSPDDIRCMGLVIGRV